MITGNKVYILGDAVINRRAIPTLGKLNGRKILGGGNHDTFRLEEYIPYFEDIKGCVSLKDYILTHIPVHPSQKNRFKGNIHGHLHSENIKIVSNNDDWYKCVSVEQINYIPVNFESLI